MKVWDLASVLLGRLGRNSTTDGPPVTRHRAAQVVHFFRRVGNSLSRRATARSASLYRRTALRDAVFIGVTGSCGKSTTKELIAAILSSRLRGCWNEGNANLPMDIARTVLRVRPWDQFCVIEIAAAVRGERIPLEKSLRFVKPHVGVVTNIGMDHFAAFGSVEAIAEEKGKLVASLPQDGLAVLNADDVRVMSMRARGPGRILTYGLDSEAALRAENLRSKWPERLSFDLWYDGESHFVQTQLCGSHWVHSVLASIAVGLEMGVPLSEAIQAVGRFPPFERRMEPVAGRDGITFIRDDYKAPLGSIPHALGFVRESQARRKIVVIGNISDYVGNSDRKYAAVARQALDVADHVVFVGPWATKSLRAKNHPRGEVIRAFYSAESAAGYVQALLEPGDLVLLKGTRGDQLAMLLGKLGGTLPGPPEVFENKAAPSGSGRLREDLPSLALGVGPHGAAHSKNGVGNSAVSVGADPEPGKGDGHWTKHSAGSVVVGLGNRGARFQDTPHNVGQRIVDELARSLGTEWKQLDHAAVAKVDGDNGSFYLVKLLAEINESGPVLRDIGRELGFEWSDCILVHDDLDLPLGSVRIRMRGSAGGHRGVRSILQTLGTDELRRVKVGIGRPEAAQDLKMYLLDRFPPALRPQVDAACAEAAGHVLQMLGFRSSKPNDAEPQAR
jgi:UDP-N-acetylmuramoyl-tripeptide--D-alanyl-D-alanine ligase